jgi:hypothetical protein
MRALLSLLVPTLAFVLAAAAPAMAEAPPDGWKTFRYPELHVSFRAPATAQPVLERTEVTTGSSKAPYTTMVVVDGGRYGFILSVVDETGNAESLDIEGVAPRVVESLKAAFVGPVRTLAWPGGEARAYDATGPAVVARGRVMMSGRRVYQVLVLSETDSLPPFADAFIESVQTLP